MRILNEVKPKYFLLENVEMGDKWERILSKAIGVNGIHINSSLVSAQNRKRIYWTNIGMKPSGLFGDMQSIIKQPKDRGILLKDVLESDVDDKYYLSENSFIFDRIKNNHPFIPRVPNENQKSNCLKIGGSGVDDLIVHNTMSRSSTTGKGGTGHLSRNDGKTYCLDTGNTTAINKDNLVMQLNPSTESNGCQPYQQNRIYDTNGISPAKMKGKSDLLINTSRIRRLTPIECERLQTVKDNYTNYVSDSQRYKMLGNGWTIEVIAHIFKYLNK